uniref:TATA-box binding protein associated factor 3 n=1 Tax=Rousettus aegyptiacus TaxID=9407 RepID=A0A7J8EB06_ROUAE|nr:TATA-box binding protein associated factor 3 [Rousettus aegyptiacus]
MAAQTQFWMTSVKPSSLWGLAFTNSKTTFTTLSPSRSRIRSLHFLLARTTYFSFLSLEVKMQRKEKNTFLTTCHPSCLPKKKKKKSRCPPMGGLRQRPCRFPWRQTTSWRRRRSSTTRISWASGRWTVRTPRRCPR